MNIVIVSDTIKIEELKEIAKEFYGSMIKGVVDIDKEIVAFGGQYHIDSNMKLIENGSIQKNIWGFNINFDEPKDGWIAYTSLINIRPVVGNRTMEVKDENIRNRMKKIIDSKII
jgi:Protein of unknown function (DUF5674)